MKNLELNVKFVNIKLGMKRLFFTIVLAVANLFVVGCDDKNGDSAPTIKRHEFDAPVFAINLGEDFEEYRAANADYIIESKSTADKFVMGGYVDTDTNQYLLQITVTKNRYSTVESIVATPENKKSSEKLMRYYLGNFDAEGLGQWQGANWKTIAAGGAVSAGVYQTVEQALMQLGTSLSGLTIDAIFSIISGRSYAVATIENEVFKLSLINSFYRLDYDVLVGLLDSNWSKLQADNRFTSYKLGFGTLNYVWFYYALDLHDNVFNMSAYADDQKLVVKTIRLTIPEDVSSDEQVAAWKEYAAGDATLSLGEFRKAYLADSTGAEVEPLASQAAAIAYVESNGRPSAFDNEVVLEYAKGDATLLITLDAKYVIIDIY